jgi:hypothetical protein
MSLRAQEIEDVPGLDAEVTGELLNLNTAGCRSYGRSNLLESTGNDSVAAQMAPVRSVEYSLSKPRPIFGRQVNLESAIHRPPLLRGRPAALVVA